MGTLLAAVLALVSIAVLLLAVSFVVLARTAGKIGRVTEDLSHFLRTTEEELVPSVRDARNAIGNVDRLVVKLTQTVERADRVMLCAERLLDGTYVGSTTAKVVRSTASGLISVYEGVKQGIRTLRSSEETNKGGKTDER